MKCDIIVKCNLCCGVSFWGDVYLELYCNVFRKERVVEVFVGECIYYSCSGSCIFGILSLLKRVV